MNQFKLVLDEMRDLDVLSALRVLGEEIPRNRECRWLSASFGLTPSIAGQMIWSTLLAKEVALAEKAPIACTQHYSRSVANP